MATWFDTECRSTTITGVNTVLSGGERSNESVRTSETLLRESLRMFAICPPETGKGSNNRTDRIEVRI